MDQERFHGLCLQASSLAVRDRDRIGNLRLTQQNERGEPIIREPEMLHTFCRTLDKLEWQITYGIEVPTDGSFRFVPIPGNRRVKARHDLVLLAGDKPDALVELKREQPASRGEDYPAISKDLRKLLLEMAPGKSMFHICHASDAGTLRAVVGKYVAAFAFAWSSVDSGEAERASGESWFSIHILVLYDRSDEKKPVLYHYAVRSLAALRTAMPGLTIEQFTREVIRRD